MEFFIKVFFSKCDQIRRKLWIWSHVLKKSLMKNFIFCAVTHKENVPSNKTRALTKSMNMDIWVVGKLNQLFIRGLFTEINFSKNKY